MDGTLKFMLIVVLNAGNLKILQAQEIRHPPDIDKPLFPKTIYFQSAETITISCQATGTPSPSYTWERNGVAVESEYISSDPETGTLRIESASQREEGVYRCLANNTWGTAVSHSIHLIKTEYNPFVKEEAVRKSATEGGSASISCRNPPHSNPPAKLSWYTLSTGGEDDASSLGATNRVGWDETGTLHFAYVVKGDQLTNREYACSSQNPKVSTIILGSKVRLAVTSPGETVRDSKPRTLYTSGRKTEEIEKIATLECFFAGKPLPTIRWLDRNSKEVTEANGRMKIEDFGRRLVITNTTENDEGEYTCIGINTLGEKSESMYLNITSRPIWEQPPKSQTVIERNDVTFTCKARAARGENPPADPVWFINGDRLQENDTRLVSPTTLYLISVLRDYDLMNVQCLVENEIGTIFQDTFLNILLPIQFTAKPPMVIRVEQGDLINLTVDAYTDPSQKLNYQWSFKGSDVQLPRPGHSLSHDSRTLIINTTLLSNDQLDAIMGTYKCLVSHTYERKSVQVLVRKPQINTDITITQQPDAVVMIDHDDVVNMTVTAITDPSLPLRFLWKRNDVNLHSNQRPEFSFSEDLTTLTINTTSLTDKGMTNVPGVFVCTIDNTFVKVKVEVTVKLVHAPVTEGVVIVEASSDFWVIAVVLGILILVGAVLLIVFVLRHRYPKRVYLLEKKELKSKLNPEKDVENDHFQTM